MDSTINIFLYLPYHISIHLVFLHLSKLQILAHFISKPFTMLIIDLSSASISFCGVLKKARFAYIEMHMRDHA